MDIETAYGNEAEFACEALKIFIAKELKPEYNIEADIIKLESLVDNVNWNLLEKIAARNGLIAILQSVLSKKCIPEKQLRKWRQYSIQTLYNYSQLEYATKKVFKILNDEAIPAVVMRGMALTQWLYSDPVFRPMVDVDILIHANEKGRFKEVFESHGLFYSRKLRSQYVYDIENVKFEIHWSFLTPKRYRSIADFSYWIENRQEIDLGADKIYGFSAEDEFLDLICHAFIHHELDTLLKLTDIMLVAESSELNWKYIGQWCQNAKMTKQFSFTLGLIDYILGCKLLEKLPYENVLPRNVEKAYQAYMAYYFQLDTITHLLRRKRVLLFVAKNTVEQIKQAIRFVSKDQISEALKLFKR